MILRLIGTNPPQEPLSAVFWLWKFACYMWEKHTTDTGQSFGKDLGAARSRLGSAHDVMPRVVVVVIVIVVVIS